MVDEKKIRKLRYGSPDPLPERRLLRAGPVTAVLEEGGLRYIRYGGQEIVRGIYAAVRDRNWGTIKPVFREFEAREKDGGFEVRFVAEHRQAEIDFEWEGTIVGRADGSIDFSFDGVSRSTFLKNRIGFCVLHPSELAGRKVEVETTAGTIAGAFPDRISPHQPFLDMTAIRHEIEPSLMTELRFEGDLFEMEDQRNWTDASYKTYCTPLKYPFPVEIAEGQRIRQSISLRLLGQGRQAQRRETFDRNAPLTVTFEDQPVGKIPQIGFGITPGHIPDGAEEAALNRLRPSFLRATIRLNEPHWPKQLDIAAANAARLGAGLELETVGGDGEDGYVLASLVQAIAEKAVPVDAVFAFPAAGYVSTGALSARLKDIRDSSGLGFKVGGGSRAYFTEMNRRPPVADTMEVVMYTVNPQVHAFDLSSMVETVSAQADTVRSARGIVGDLPLCVGPITFKPRLNPDATSEEAIRKSEDRKLHEDPRQHSLFGAAWTLGSVRHLAEAGADRAAYFETVGPLGVLREGANAFSPLYHAFAELGPLQGETLLSGRSDNPLVCEAMAVRRSDGRTTILLANYTDENIRVRLLTPFASPAVIRVLDEKGRTPDGSANPVERPFSVDKDSDGRYELELLPFAFVALEERNKRPPGDP